MKFTPEKYKIADKPMQAFIDPDEINYFLYNAVPTVNTIERIIKKSLRKQRLNLSEVAMLVNAEDPELIEKIKQGAKALKEKVYGKRIVLFAPLYVGNYCVNNCKYCGFRASNNQAKRKTLSHNELVKNVEALEEAGHKRLILVFGEHKKYSPDYIAETVKTVYGVKKDKGTIRRVNINAAPLEIEGYKKVKEAGIGTYQVFQETYHPETYKYYHTGGMKANYENRQISLDKAMEAGLDDVGIGALFGLYDWKFEVLGLIRHVNHLESCYNIGPHTISFPRIQESSSSISKYPYKVSDEEFSRIIAILRLAVPYTGMILTARESEKIRNEVLQYGCSQIDAGTKIEMGAYARQIEKKLELNREQFYIHDDRSLSEIMEELIDLEYLPSFCTACYRLGRTGEHFMEFSVPGFIKRYCQPNALLTMAEYLYDYGNESTRKKGWKLIEKEINKNIEDNIREKLISKLEQIKSGKRDLYF